MSGRLGLLLLELDVSDVSSSDDKLSLGQFVLLSFARGLCLLLVQLWQELLLAGLLWRLTRQMARCMGTPHSQLCRGSGVSWALTVG